MTRNIYFDAVRGLAIILVVGIHSFDVINHENADVFLVALRQLLNVAVPLFLALSGFFLSRIDFSTSNSIKSFWKKQIPKVWIPCVIWGTPYFVTAIMDGGSVYKQFVFWMIGGYGVYYFIILIIQCYILLPLLKKRTLTYPLGGGAFLILSISCSFIICYYGLNQLPLVFYAGPCILWLPFFWIAIYVSQKGTDYKIGALILWVLIAIVLEIMESLYINISLGGGFGIKPSSILYSLIAILILFSSKVENLLKKRGLTGVLAKTGRYAFPIYLIHYFFIEGIKSQGYAKEVLPFVSWMFSWLIVFIVSFLIVYVGKRFLPDRVKIILGFS